MGLQRRRAKDLARIPDVRTRRSRSRQQQGEPLKEAHSLACPAVDSVAPGPFQRGGPWAGKAGRGLPAEAPSVPQVAWEQPRRPCPIGWSRTQAGFPP